MMAYRTQMSIEDGGGDALDGWIQAVMASAMGKQGAGVMQIGTAPTNDRLPIVPEEPHGGVKQSGNSKNMSVSSLERSTEVKHVLDNLRNER